MKRRKEIQTSLFRVDSNRPDRDIVRKCATIVRAGGLVAFPTETVYGLGADARSSEAVTNIFAAKGRPSDNPLIVHTADAEQAFALARHVPYIALELARRFWPGPLTLILHKADGLPGQTTAGLDTFGVRVPSHPVALMLLSEAKVPIAAPSANASGKPSPTCANHVIDDLWGKIDAILDGGPTDIGLESTVLDLTVSPPLILRPGGVTIEQIREIVPDVESITAHDAFRHVPTDDGPRSPGLKYRHYAPNAPAHRLLGDPDDVTQSIRSLEVDQPRPSNGYVISAETAALLRRGPAEIDVNKNDRFIVIGSRRSPEDAARGLYGALRALDRQQVRAIFIEVFDAQGIGTALFDRVHRATSE